MYKTFLSVTYLLYTLNGIIKRIPEQRTDIHRLHKFQFLAIRHTGKADTMTLTLYGLCCQNCVKYAVACLILCFIRLDLFLHLFQILRWFLTVSLCLQKRDLMLEIMIFLIHNLNAFLRQLIVLILHFQNILKRIHFKLHLKLPYLDMIGIQNRQTT